MRSQTMLPFYSVLTNMIYKQIHIKKKFGKAAMIPMMMMVNFMAVKVSLFHVVITKRKMMDIC